MSASERAPDAVSRIVVERQSAKDAAALVAADEAVRREPARSEWHGVLESDCNQVFLARVEGNAVGLLLSYDLARPDGARMRLVYEVETAPGFRRQGVATALIKRCLEDASRAGVGKVWLTTEADNASANALYRSLGARCHAEGDRVYGWRLDSGS